MSCRVTSRIQISVFLSSKLLAFVLPCLPQNGRGHVSNNRGPCFSLHLVHPLSLTALPVERNLFSSRGTCQKYKEFNKA